MHYHFDELLAEPRDPHMLSNGIPAIYIFPGMYCAAYSTCICPTWAICERPPNPMQCRSLIRPDEAHPFPEISCFRSVQSESF